MPRDPSARPARGRCDRGGGGGKALRLRRLGPVALLGGPLPPRVAGVYDGESVELLAGRAGLGEQRRGRTPVLRRRAARGAHRCGQAEREREGGELRATSARRCDGVTQGIECGVEVLVGAEQREPCRKCAAQPVQEARAIDCAGGRSLDRQLVGAHGLVERLHDERVLGLVEQLARQSPEPGGPPARTAGVSVDELPCSRDTAAEL